MARISSRNGAVERYFRDKAKYYDDVESQVYWNLSDDLLWYMLKKVALGKIKTRTPRVLDAGGGTGRWALKIAKHLRGSNCVIYDISNDMLSVASDKIRKNSLSNRVSVVKGDLERMDGQNDSQYDLAICFHNVLGFVDDYRKAFREVSRTIKPGGLFVTVVPNKYHMLYFSMTRKEIGGLDSIMDRSLGRFNKEMPLIHVFTPESMRAMYKKAGFEKVLVLGFPIAIYPQLEDTAIHGSGRRTKEILEDRKAFDKIIGIEKRLVFSEEAAARGNNLFVVGVKSPR
jgi:ubiquinone/menaquinone biosynthesis C-methylase UbiE